LIVYSPKAYPIQGTYVEVASLYAAIFVNTMTPLEQFATLKRPKPTDGKEISTFLQS